MGNSCVLEDLVAGEMEVVNASFHGKINIFRKIPDEQFHVIMDLREAILDFVKNNWDWDGLTIGNGLLKHGIGN